MPSSALVRLVCLSLAPRAPCPRAIPSKGVVHEPEERVEADRTHVPTGEAVVVAMGEAAHVPPTFLITFWAAVTCAGMEACTTDAASSAEAATVAATVAKADSCKP